MRRRCGLAGEFHCAEGDCPWPRRPSTRVRRPRCWVAGGLAASAPRTEVVEPALGDLIMDGSRIVRAAIALDPELFENRVTSGLHSQCLIGALRRLIGVFDVEPKADHVGVAARFLADVLVEARKTPLPRYGWAT